MLSGFELYPRWVPLLHHCFPFYTGEYNNISHLIQGSWLLHLNTLCGSLFKYTVSNLPRQQMLLRRIAPERLWKHFPRVGIKTMTFSDYLIPLSTLLLHARWLMNSSFALWGCIYGHCWFLFFPEELSVKTSLSKNGRYLINHPLNNPSRFVKLFRIFGWDPWN